MMGGLFHNKPKAVLRIQRGFWLSSSRRSRVHPTLSETLAERHCENEVRGQIDGHELSHRQVQAHSTRFQKPKHSRSGETRRPFS